MSASTTMRRQSRSVHGWRREKTPGSGEEEGHKCAPSLDAAGSTIPGVPGTCATSFDALAHDACSSAHGTSHVVFLYPGNHRSALWSKGPSLWRSMSGRSPVSGNGERMPLPWIHDVHNDNGAANGDCESSG